MPKERYMKENDKNIKEWLRKLFFGVITALIANIIIEVIKPYIRIYEWLDRRSLSFPAVLIFMAAVGVLLLILTVLFLLYRKSEKRKLYRAAPLVLFFCGTALMFTSFRTAVYWQRETGVNAVSFENWVAWGGINAAPQGNTVTLNGAADAAGYLTTVMDTGLKGKTMVLVIENGAASEYSNNCLIKITANAGDEVIRPLGINPLIYGEYTPTGNTRVEFPLPSNFDGKLGFVFYRVKLNNLKITASYK
jgi:hypothetical protein